MSVNQVLTVGRNFDDVGQPPGIRRILQVDGTNPFGHWGPQFDHGRRNGHSDALHGLTDHLWTVAHRIDYGCRGHLF